MSARPRRALNPQDLTRSQRGPPQARATDCRRSLDVSQFDSRKRHEVDGKELCRFQSQLVEWLRFRRGGTRGWRGRGCGARSAAGSVDIVDYVSSRRVSRSALSRSSETAVLRVGSRPGRNGRVGGSGCKRCFLQTQVNAFASAAHRRSLTLNLLHRRPRPRVHRARWPSSRFDDPGASGSSRGPFAVPRAPGQAHSYLARGQVRRGDSLWAERGDRGEPSFARGTCVN